MSFSKNPIFFFFTLLALLIHLPIFGQLETARMVIQDLSAPEMHGRAYVKNGHKKAAAYLAKEFKREGTSKVWKQLFAKISHQRQHTTGSLGLENRRQNFSTRKGLFDRSEQPFTQRHL